VVGDTNEEEEQVLDRLTPAMGVLLVYTCHRFYGSSCRKAYEIQLSFVYDSVVTILLKLTSPCFLSSNTSLSLSLQSCGRM